MERIAEEVRAIFSSLDHEKIPLHPVRQDTCMGWNCARDGQKIHAIETRSQDNSIGNYLPIEVLNCKELSIELRKGCGFIHCRSSFGFNNKKFAFAGCDIRIKIGGNVILGG